MKEKLLISSCLCGNQCKYNGDHNQIVELDKLKERYELICICPEVLGKLPIPRDPSEIQKDGRVVSNQGIDVTDAYNTGARLALSIAQKYGVTKALLKDGSPSCGVCFIYDGSFTGVKISGDGITTKLLKKHKIKVFSSNDITKL